MNYSNFVASISMIDRIHTNFSPSNDLLWQVSLDCISHLDLVDFVIYSYDEDNGTLSQEAGYGLKVKEDKKLEDPLSVVVGQGIVGDAAKRMNYQLVDDTSADVRYIQDGRRHDSELSVPIIWDGKLLGVLDSEHPRRNYYKEIHIDLFYMVAAILGPRIVNFRKKKKKVYSKENIYYRQFIDLMEINHLYKDENLKLERIASMLSINKCYLSKIINQASKKKFTEIVNAYRIENVKEAMHAENHKYFTIMSLAYDAGFSSKSSFNFIFKKETGLTPTQYIRQLI